MWQNSWDEQMSSWVVCEAGQSWRWPSLFYQDGNTSRTINRKCNLWNKHTITLCKFSYLTGLVTIIQYRFSAFWLRSKCSICSYQLNIWYVPHRGTSILNWFLDLGEDTGACSGFSTGWPGIAVPPGSAQKIKIMSIPSPTNEMSILHPSHISNSPENFHTKEIVKNINVFVDVTLP